jgi:hypothetical protein
MTEAEWGDCTDPAPMLEFLQSLGLNIRRKVRLFSAACCRRVWHLGTDRRSNHAIEVAERDADGQATRRQRRFAVMAAGLAAGEDWTSQPGCAVATAAMRAVTTPVDGAGAAMLAGWAVAFDARGSQAGETAVQGGLLAEAAAEQAAQADLVRDIFGNPFRGRLVDPRWVSWNDGLVPRLAQSAYDDRQLPVGSLDRSRLAVLADALEDAGCTDRALLDHLRGPEVHVRGCWAVDALLGRT